MARIALLASGITNPLFSVLQFGSELRAAGHDITVFAPQKSGALIAHADLAHREIPEPKITTFNALLPKPSAKERGWGGRRKRLSRAVEAFGVDQFAKDLKTLDPHLVISDCELHPHMITTMGLGFPVIQASNICITPPSLQSPPLHYSNIPGQGFRGSKLGVFLAWSHYLSRKFATLARNWLRDWGADHPSALFALARQYDVKLAPKLRMFSWLMPWTYRIPTLICRPRALDLPIENNDHITFTGSLIWENRPEQADAPDLIARFANAPDTKRIYVAFGTMHANGADLMQRIWTVIGQNPDWQAICVVGKHWAQAPEHAPPDNVHVVPWAPQPQILAHSDLCIVHGGAGSFMEAAVAGVPQLVYPNTNDQLGNAARVEFHNIGQWGAHNDDVQTIAHRIAQLLRDDTIKSAARAMAEKCRIERDQDTALRLVETILKAQTTDAQP